MRKKNHLVNVVDPKDIKNSSYQAVIMNRRIPFILQKDEKTGAIRIITKSVKKVSFNQCNCGHCNPKVETISAQGIAKLMPGEKFHVKFGVKLSLARTLNNVIQEQVYFFNEQLKGEIQSYNNLVNDLNSRMPELTMDRIQGVRLSKAYHFTPGTVKMVKPSVTSIVNEEAAVKEDEPKE